jgi:hypothetical protein
MPKKDEQNEKRSKISMKIGEVQVEFEGTSENIKKLMDKELFNFAKKLEATAKHLPSQTESTSKTATNAQDAVSKSKTNIPPIKTTKSEPLNRKSRLNVGTKTSKSSKKRTSWNNLATALLMMCIILLASLIGVVAFYLPVVNDLDSQIVEKDIEIAELNRNASSLNAQVSDLQDTIDQKDNEITNLRESAEYLNSLTAHYLSILLLNESSYLVAQREITTNANESIMIYQYNLDYAGYVSVNLESTSNTTYVQLLYTYNGVNYNQNFAVGESGTAYFPILPTMIEIWVGNTEVSNGDSVNATVTAIYYY